MPLCAWRKRLIIGAVVPALMSLAFVAALVVPLGSISASPVHQTSTRTSQVNAAAQLLPDYTPVDPTKLQPNIPATFPGGTPDPHGDSNYTAEIKASLHPNDLAALDAKPTPTSGPFAVKPGDKLDVVRMKKNGGQPVIISTPNQLIPSSIGIPTMYTVWYQEPGCIQPPAGFDPGKAAQSQRDAYGFPPLHAGESVVAYDARVSWMKTRSCEYRIGNINHAAFSNSSVATAKVSSIATQAFSVTGNNPTMFTLSGPLWTGNIADEPCVEYQYNLGCSTSSDPYIYDDTYSQWTLKGISGTNSTVGTWSAWMGLGGITNSPANGIPADALVQSGSQDEAVALGCGTTTCNWYALWVENLDHDHPDAAIFPWGENSTHYGITVYAEEWGNSTGTNAYAEVGDVTDKLWYSTNSFVNGANYGFDIESAEEVVENTRPGNPQFSTQAFNGIAVYEGKTFNNWAGMDNRWHDWVKAKGQCGNYLDSISAILVDNNYSPPDDNQITWEYSC